MIVIYEVIHSVGDEEQKLYLVSEGDTEADAEAQAVAHYTAQGLINANHFKLAENPDLTFEVPVVPQVLTNQGDGTWLES